MLSAAFFLSFSFNYSLWLAILCETWSTLQVLHNHNALILIISLENLVNNLKRTHRARCKWEIYMFFFGRATGVACRRDICAGASDRVFFFQNKNKYSPGGADKIYGHCKYREGEWASAQ